MQKDRSCEFWRPDTRFLGETVFTVGGGPSLIGFDFDRLRGKRVIAVNSAGYDIPWAEILLFHDNSWFENETNRALVDSWQGIVVSCSRHAKRDAPDTIFRINMKETDHFCVGEPCIKEGRHSGQTAVTLAVSMGAKRVILLGYDQKTVDGQSHYHVGKPLYTEEHTRRMTETHPTYFKGYWKGWNLAAQRVDCQILNATPGSALLEFPFVNLDDILNELESNEGSSS